MRWPVLRFERFFERHLRRKAADHLRRERDLMIAAITANTNMDSSENRELRSDRLENIRRAYKEGVEFLYAPEGERLPDADEAAMEADPLFRHMRDNASELKQGVSRPVSPEEGAGRRLLGDPA